MKANVKLQTELDELRARLAGVLAEVAQHRVIHRAHNETLYALGCTQDDNGNWINKEASDLRARLGTAEQALAPANPPASDPAQRAGELREGFAWYDGTYLSKGEWRMVEIFRPCWVDKNRQDLAWRYLDRSEPDDITENLLANCKGRFVAIHEPDRILAALGDGKGEAK